ncbi:putative baseplate assembly protein [Amycolatopsis vancoresmycina]|uniref:putative baseplate assembly protein n=1 Tax=Amycolatopsis vancoresmycina TaxID=208444 RepID=UPI000525684B|nr:putative baseplate assembly protein [Amycolatopsis vancoresmycina]
MSAVWWERGAAGEARLRDGEPELVDATREAVRAGVRGRIAGYTPDWTNPDRQDAGVALVRLFGTQAEPVLDRVNRLPAKILAEELATAGVRRRPASAATALLEFTVRPPDGASVLVPAGTQAAAAGRVVFETEEDLYATPATLGAIAVEEAGTLAQLPLGPSGPGRVFAPFGRVPEPGNGLWLGLAGAASPYPALSLGFVVDPGPAAPAVSGVVPPVPVVRWDVLDGGRFVPAELVRDGTGGLLSSGTVELRVPRTWAPGSPPGFRPGPQLRWLRVQAEAAGAVLLSGLRLNTVAATAARTIRNEPLQPVRDPAGSRRRMKLSQVPILAGTVVIEVDDDPGGDVFGTTRGVGTRWQEVESLAGFGADDRVFVVDHESGEVFFGDGSTGAAVPPGFRNVRAVSYRVGGGQAGAVRAGAVTGVVTALPFVTGVTNPFPASGGTDAEQDNDAVRRGAGELRARGRAVAPADYGLLALRAPGASVARAQGVPGLHPGFPGRPIPGVVGVLVVSPGGTTPTEATLRAVSDFLAREVAPAGVTVVAAPASFAEVVVEAQVSLDPGQDRAAVLTRAGDAVTAYLDPVGGGETGAGWPFGSAVRQTPLVRRLLAVDGVLAVSQLSLTVDGLRLPPCADAAIPANALVRPGRPVLVPAEGGRS